MSTFVKITYGVRKHPDYDGWLPVVTEHVEGNKPHTSAPWGRPLDEDHALFLAKDTAEDWASRYGGDYTVVVSEAAPERGPRRNPRRPPPPPPSHTFALEADPYQQGLFAPSSYEAKPKKRTVEPAPVDERQVDLFASPPPPKKNPRAAENGRYHYVMSCPGSTYEDIQALQESEQTVSRATFAKAIGSQAWRDIQASLGYDRDFPITKDWHVGYYKGVFRGVPCYFLRHSRIEHIYTLDGKLGPSLAGDDE